MTNVLLTKQNTVYALSQKKNTGTLNYVRMEEIMRTKAASSVVI